MRKCLQLWTDPTRGQSSSAVGPYRCGRKHGHPGAHAWDGNGASALWSRDGELLLSIQQVPEGGLPALMDEQDESSQGGPDGGRLPGSGAESGDAS